MNTMWELRIQRYHGSDIDSCFFRTDEVDIVAAAIHVQHLLAQCAYIPGEPPYSMELLMKGTAGHVNEWNTEQQK